MMDKRTNNRMRRLVTIAGIGLLAVNLIVVPAASADRRGRGSVRHSSRSKPRTSGRAAPGRATPGRATPRRSPASPRRTTARRSSRRSYGRYSARKDAWRDYRRWRAITGLIRGAYIATRPPRTTTVVVTGTSYYYSGGVYYTASGTGYVVVSAPPQAVVYGVPTATTVVYVRSTPYYYYGGTYYIATTQPAPPPPPPPEGTDLSQQPEMTDDDHNYQVVTAPVGATVPYLPDEADKQSINGRSYFLYDGAYYRPFVSDGDTVYVVVEDPREA